MIKTPVLLLFIAAATIGCSQKGPAQDWTEILKKERFNWYSIEDSIQSIIKTTRFIQIRKPLTDCIKDTKDTSHISFSNIHWVDLNADGHEDFIFSGWCLPYPETHIFIWDNGDYKRSLKTGGKIIELKQYADSTILFVRGDGCCCIYYSIITKVLIPKNSTESFFTNSVEWAAQTRLNNINNLQKFRGKSDTISLRINPQLNDTIREHECTGYYKIKGNITIEFKKNVSGIILKDSLINTEKWSLIMVNPNDLHIETEFEGQSFEKNKTYSVGWVWRKEIDVLE